VCEPDNCDDDQEQTGCRQQHGCYNPFDGVETPPVLVAPIHSLEGAAVEQAANGGVEARRKAVDERSGRHENDTDQERRHGTRTAGSGDHCVLTEATAITVSSPGPR
jgi:hypothetical protein